MFEQFEVESFLSGNDLDRSQPSEPSSETVHLWPLVKSYARASFQKLSALHSDQLNGHLRQIRLDESEYRQKHLESCLAFLVEADLSKLEQDFYVSQNSIPKNRGTRLELGILAPIFIAQFIYMVYAEPQK